MSLSPTPNRPPQSSSPPPAGAPTLLPSAADGASGEHRVPIWLHRLSLFTFVLFCVVVGMAMVVLPWSPQWTQNSLLAPYPGLRSILRLDFVRGVISGLGLLDLWFGIWEALHYREPE